MELDRKRISHYQLVRIIGSGSMGEVYLAEDMRGLRQVAIKILRLEAATFDPQATDEMLRLFQREAFTIAQFNHAQILPLFDYGQTHMGNLQLAYLVMPYHPAGSLLDWLRQRANLPHTGLMTPEQVAHVIGQAASALQYAHEHQVVHRDVKPANFLIRGQSAPDAFPDLLLADFGIAQFEQASAVASQVIRGTPGYMAPEQWEAQAVPASDQHALAIMTYELLTGGVPFQGSPVTLMHAHLDKQPQPPSAHYPHLPLAIDGVLLKALAKRPEQRYPSIAIFAQACTAALTGKGAHTIVRQFTPASHTGRGAETIVRQFTPASHTATPAVSPGRGHPDDPGVFGFSDAHMPASQTPSVVRTTASFTPPLPRPAKKTGGISLSPDFGLHHNSNFDHSGERSQSTSVVPPATRKKRPVFFLVMSAVLALIIVFTAIVGTVITLKGLSDKSTGAKTLVSIAATNLARTPGAHYVGTIANTYGDKIQADLQVTNRGSAYGILRQNGEPFEVLVIDHKTFLKAAQAFWRTHGAPLNLLDAYARQWVKVDAHTIGFDIQKFLAPLTLGQQLNQEARASLLTLGPQTTINGIQVRQVNTPQAILYITTAAPHRIVRIETSSMPQLSSVPRTSAYILSPLLQTTDPNPVNIRLDVSNQPISEEENLVEQIRQNIPDLRSAVDFEAHFTLQGQAVLDPCTPSECIATLIISNSETSTNAERHPQLTVSITIDMTLDGVPIRTCSGTKTMPLNGETTVECTALYSIAPSSTPMRHLVEAIWSAVAQAMLPADIQQANDDLNQELQQWDSEVRAVTTEIDAAVSTGKQFTESALLDWISRVGGQIINPDSSDGLGNLAQDDRRIYLGSYKGHGIISNGQEIPISSNLNPGLQTLQNWARKYGGNPLSDIKKPLIFAQLQAAINIASSIVFNVGRDGFPASGLTEQEFRYILSTPDLLRKTIFVFGATW